MPEENAPYIYDRVPYPNVSHSLSHPDRLATVARLVGMNPAPIEQCRVLELGCAGGGNLIPMAQALPGSEFVGLDLSKQQISDGERFVAALGLSNIRLEQLDILDVEADFGQFDYIIAHGVYSWVSPAVREKLLTICRQNLAAQGVAYISYNVYPGWNMLGVLREMMLYHTRDIADPAERAAEARNLLEFLAKSISTGSNTHGSFLYVYANYIKDYFVPKDDSLLLHDELAEINTPVYFHQFAEQVERHGLRYVGDVNFASMLAANLSAEVSERLRGMVKNTIELEQYLDFLRNRMFRQSLVAHQEIRLQARLSSDRLTEFYVAASAVPESSEPDIESVSVEKFKALDGADFSTDHPLTKAAMLHLIEIWPRSIAFKELVAAAWARLGAQGPTGESDVQLMGANLLKAYTYSENLLEFHVYAARFVTAVSDYPTASPTARYQAARGDKITNRRHERVTLDKMSAALLTYLDGSRDRAALRAVVKEEDLVEIERRDGQPLEAAAVDEVINELLQKKLEQFAAAALLVG